MVDAQGVTLYHLSAEQNGKFICISAQCVQAWHPLAVAAATKPTSNLGSLGTTRRPDATHQVTFRGMPLYTFAQDQKPGDAKGQGLKDVGTWSAVRTSTSASSTSHGPAKAPTPAPAQPSNGY